MRRFAFKSDNLLPRRDQRGVTLIEFLIVVVLVGIFGSLAGPLFRDVIIQQSIRDAAFDLMSDLTFARSEAVKRNATVTITRAGTWGGGWTITAGDITLKKHPAVAPNITITVGSPSLDFNLNGRASGLVNFIIDDAGDGARIVARCVSVDPSGRPQSIEGGCS